MLLRAQAIVLHPNFRTDKSSIPGRIGSKTVPGIDT